MSTSAPPSRRIAAELRRRIESGELMPGARVPSTRDIVDEWGVAMATATKALTELRHLGLVRAVRGVGTVVEADRAATRAAPPRRRPISSAADLTNDRIVGAGIAVADAEGLDAVSMRRIASETGVATMSLYRHLKDKDDLLLKMQDHVFRELRPPADPPDGWRPRVELAARMLWDTFRRHPWLASAMSITRPQPLAGAMPYLEFVFAALDRIGLDHETTFTAYITLVSSVRGMAVNLEFEAEAQAITGVDQDEWLNAQEPSVRAIVDAAGAFPVFSLYLSKDYDFNLDKLFEFGLARLLDGLSTLAA